MMMGSSTHITVEYFLQKKEEAAKSCFQKNILAFLILASPALHVADMANIRQIFSIPQSPLGLPISFTSVLTLCACVLCLFTGNEC